MTLAALSDINGFNACGDVSGVTETPLSGARAWLSRQYLRLAEARADFEACTNQFQKVEALIADPAPIKARLEALEAEHAADIEAWALGGGEGSPPQLQHATTIAALKAQLAQAEMISAAAKGALTKINGDVLACQADTQAAIKSVRSAADNVLVEIARQFAGELETAERRAALLRGSLFALQRFFELEGFRGRPIGDAAAAVRRAIPTGPFELAPASINKAVNDWKTLADRLMTDETAELTLPYGD